MKNLLIIIWLGVFINCGDVTDELYYTITCEDLECHDPEWSASDNRICGEEREECLGETYQCSWIVDSERGEDKEVLYIEFRRPQNGCWEVYNRMEYMN